MTSKINEIRNAMSEGDLDEALFFTEKYFRKTRFGNDIISLSSRFKILEAERAKGIISSEDENLRRNKIIASTLELLSKIERSYKKETEQISDDERNQVIDEINKYIKQKMEKSKEGKVNILIVGKTGVGKSSIINTLLGKDVAEVGHFEPTTFEVKVYESQINKIQLRIFDTPGLCDKLEEFSNDESYISKIKNKIEDERIDCVLFAAELHSSRLELGDQKAIKVITNSFGSKIWENTVLIFTKADETEESEFFNYLINRKLIIQNEIKKWSNVNIAQNIPVVATSMKKEVLPNGKYWMSDLFTTIFTKMSEEGYAPFLHTILDSKNEKLNIQESDKEKINKKLLDEAKKESSFMDKVGNVLGAFGSIFGERSADWHKHMGGGGWR